MDDITPLSKDDSSRDFIVHQIPTSEKENDVSTREPVTQLKVRFDKFIQLVATHDFENIISRFGDQQIIISSDLLTELASAHEVSSEENRKIPIVFVVGLALGIVVTYVLVAK